MIELVNEAARSKKHGTWTAAMTMLERTRPERFGRRDALTVAGDEERPLQVVTAHVLADPEARAAHRQLLTSIARRADLELEPTGEDERPALPMPKGLA